MWDYFLEEHGAPTHDGNALDLKVDEALINVYSGFPTSLTFFKKSSLCIGCPYVKEATISAGEQLSVKVDVNNGYWSFLFSPTDGDYHFADQSNETICNVQDLPLGQFGVYNLTVTNSDCAFGSEKEPAFIYGALVLAACFYLLLFVGWKIVQFLSSKKSYFQCLPCCRSIEPEEITPADIKSTTKPRLKSLDIFRGITIVLMIFVNHGAGKYWFFQHAVWNGLYVADVVFPWFMWIMGVCIPMGLRSQLRKGTSKKKIFCRILQRSIKLFIIGIILNSAGGYYKLETYRIAGVLQRFSLAYLFTASFSLVCSSSSSMTQVKDNAGRFHFLLVLLPQWILYILMMVAYIMFLYLMPVPGCQIGYFGPGGISNFIDGEPSPGCIGGVTRFVDIIILGKSHIYQNPTAKSVYKTSSFDPEGILGTIPTLFQVFLGIQAGQILLSYQKPRKRIVRWITLGVVLGLVGLALCTGRFSSGPIPVNKNLWSLSYVFVTSALAYFLLAFCYVVVDVYNLWHGDPFYQTGMNSIFLYVGHFITFFFFPWQYQYGKMNSHLALLSEALFGTTLWVLTAIYLHRKGKFYTI